MFLFYHQSSLNYFFLEGIICGIFASLSDIYYLYISLTQYYLKAHLFQILNAHFKLIIKPYHQNFSSR